MDKEKEKLLKRIRKLFALGQSSNPHEAELALEKANALMAEHQLAHADIEIKDIQGSGVIEEEYCAGKGNKRLWAEQLAGGVAHMFDGNILVNRNHNSMSFTFVGFPDDIAQMKQVFQHLYDSWFSVVDADLEQAKANRDVEWDGKWTMKDTWDFKSGHGMAYAKTIRMRIIELVRERKQAVGGSETGTALVVLKDQLMKDHLSKYGSSRKRASKGSMAGQMAGQAAGQNASLSGAIE